jgi:hypothetical protein
MQKGDTQRSLGAYGEPQKLDLIRVNIAARKPLSGQPGRSSYNLSLTDRTVEEQPENLPNGLNASSSIDLEDECRLFCLSQPGEPFSAGNCYKLVAGVIELAAEANMSVAGAPSNAGKSKSVQQSPAHVH